MAYMVDDQTVKAVNDMAPHLLPDGDQMATEAAICAFAGTGRISVEDAARFFGLRFNPNNGFGQPRFTPLGVAEPEEEPRQAELSTPAKAASGKPTPRNPSARQAELDEDGLPHPRGPKTWTTAPNPQVSRTAARRRFHRYYARFFNASCRALYFHLLEMVDPQTGVLYTNQKTLAKVLGVAQGNVSRLLRLLQGLPPEKGDDLNPLRLQMLFYRRGKQKTAGKKAEPCEVLLHLWPPRLRPDQVAKLTEMGKHKPMRKRIQNQCASA